MRFPGHRFDGPFGPHYDVWHIVFTFLFLAVLIAAVVALVMYLSRQHGSTGMADHHPHPTAGPDPALQHLRMRYARGEISRDDFVTASRDLGDVTAPPSPPTGTTPPETPPASV